MPVVISDAMAIGRYAGQIKPELQGGIDPPNDVTALSGGSISAPNTITPNDPLMPPYPLNHARIGYDNAFKNASVTTAARVTLIPNTYERWRPTSGDTAVYTISSAATVDYFGIGAHNLGSADATVTIQTASSPGGTLTTRATVTPNDDKAIMVLLTDEISVREIRLTVTGSNTELGVFYAGKALVMQRPIFGGHTPITLSSVTNFNSNASDAGQWLGRDIVRQGVETSYSWELLTDQWYREYFQPFVVSAKTTPFFIAWRPDLYPDEVAYCWTEDDISPSNRGGSTKFMSVSFNAQGYAE